MPIGNSTSNKTSAAYIQAGPSFQSSHTPGILSGGFGLNGETNDQIMNHHIENIGLLLKVFMTLFSVYSIARLLLMGVAGSIASKLPDATPH
jgi:hypothetical protein